MRKICVDLMARIEGSAGISATIDDKVVTNVKFLIREGPRFVEELVKGKTTDDVVRIVPRICAICSVSHKYASLCAVEDALSMKVSDKVALLRELMHLGELIESHSLHIYYLTLPDYAGYPDLISTALTYGLDVKIALEMKEFANHILKTVSGRFIHGDNPVIGGFGCFPSKEDLIWIKNRAVQFMPFVLKTVSLFCELDYPACPEGDTLYACCHPGRNKYGLTGNEILLSTGEIIKKAHYRRLTNEFVAPHSYAKHSRYRGRSYSVGALARINNLGERLRGQAGRMYRKYFNPRWGKNPLFNNAAQALEILYAFEKIPGIIDKMIRVPNPPIPAVNRKDGRGSGIVEAPRGLLIHSYEIASGLVTHADIVTPTAQNTGDIEKYSHLAAQRLLDDGEETKIKERMEWIVRAYDPCVSCSVHMAVVNKVPADHWKGKLAGVMKLGSTFFIGLGNRDYSDDGVGLDLALELRALGLNNVWLESEFGDDEYLCVCQSTGPIIFLDAVDFGKQPGAVTFLPLDFVLSSSPLSHTCTSFLQSRLNFRRLKECYVLGIQPESVEEDTRISAPVRKAIDEISCQILGLIERSAKQM